MRQPHKDWEVRLIHKAGRTKLRPRNQAVVFGWATLTVVLLISGLAADLRTGSWRLAYECYRAALASFAILLAVLFYKRLRAIRRP